MRDSSSGSDSERSPKSSTSMCVESAAVVVVVVDEVLEVVVEAVEGSLSLLLIKSQLAFLSV